MVYISLKARCTYDSSECFRHIFSKLRLLIKELSPAGTYKINRSLGESLAVREEVEVECLNDIEIAGLLSDL
jgi:hypothetical protein